MGDFTIAADRAVIAPGAGHNLAPVHRALATGAEAGRDVRDKAGRRFRF